METVKLQKKIYHYNNYFLRLKGLMFTKYLDKDKAILLYPCKQVHTWFMNYEIVVIYMNKQKEVLWIGVLTPWSLGPFLSNSYYVLETSDLSIINHIKVGAKLLF
jgi:uncharacterized protein